MARLTPTPAFALSPDEAASPEVSGEGSASDHVADRLAVPGGRGDTGLAQGRLLQLAGGGLGQLTGDDLHEPGYREVRHPGRAPVEQLHRIDRRAGRRHDIRLHLILTARAGHLDANHGRLGYRRMGAEHLIDLEARDVLAPPA